MIHQSESGVQREINPITTPHIAIHGILREIRDNGRAGYSLSIYQENDEEDRTIAVYGLSTSEAKALSKLFLEEVSVCIGARP